MWCLAFLVQLGIVKVSAFLIGKYAVTDHFLVSACLSSRDIINIMPSMRKVDDLCVVLWSLLRDELFIGFVVGLLFGWRVLIRKGFIAIKVSMFVFIGLFAGSAVWIIFFNGPVLINWKTPVFLAGCAPVWAYVSILLKSWKTTDPLGVGRSDFVNVGEFQRGARLIKPESSSKVFASLAKNEPDAQGGISIWEGSPFPFKRENQHILITGSPGSGKTQIIYPLIQQVYKRGDKAIIWDVKGTFIQAFAGESGVDLLAAWDQRSIAWSPGADIRSQLDCQQVASIMFPHNPKESQPYFLNAARQILEAVFLYLDAQGDTWGWVMCGRLFQKRGKK